MLRFSLPIAVRNTYELRRLEYVLTTLLITPSSVIVMEEVGTVDFFYFSKQVRSGEVGRMITLRNKREEEAVTLYTFDQSRGST